MPSQKPIRELKPSTWSSTTYSEEYYSVKDPWKIISNDKFYLPLTQNFDSKRPKIKTWEKVLAVPLHPEVPKTKLQPKIVSIELSVMSCSTPSEKSDISTESIQGMF